MAYLTYWSISSQVFEEEAKVLGLEVEIINKNKSLFFVKGKAKAILFKSTDCGVNTSLGVKLANDKQLTYDILARSSLPCAGTLYLEKDEFAGGFSTVDVHYPLVVKPLDGAHGDGVMMNIKTFDELKKKLEEGFKIYKTLIIQEQIEGDEFRIFIFQGEVLLVIQRVPPFIIGNGKVSIQKLINKENKENKQRGDGYENLLSYIKNDAELLSYIEKQGYSLSCILPEGKRLQLRGNSNLGTGGTIVDVSDIVAQDIKDICIEAAHSLGLGMAGVDILTKDITKPLNKTGGVILEINATPGIGGDREFTGVNTGREILKRLFF